MFSKLFKSDGKTSSSVNEMKASSGPMKTLSRIFTFNPKKKETSSGPSKPNDVEETSSLLPIVAIRPYGLPAEMEGKRLHIWNSIFDQVHDFESIINLREVCAMFMELLEGKYVEVMLPQVIGNRFVNLSISWRGGRKDWLKTLVALRTLSKASYRSVDKLLGEGLIGRVGVNWFSTKDPHYLIKKEMPVLELGASQEGQGRLYQTLRRLSTENLPHNIPMKAIIFDELHEHSIVVELPSIQKSFETVIEKLGSNITSFQYRTMEKSFETYVNLRKWLAFMPNLRELIVELQGYSLLRCWEETGKVTLEPFPKCPHFKRYVEGPKGFGVPFLKEIIKANPTIQEVLLGEIPFNEWKHVGQLIGTLQVLTKFHSTCIPKTPKFFLASFHWAKQLTTLALWDSQDSWTPDISSEVFFEFISEFENLVDLMVATPFLRDNEGLLFLLKLKHVSWKVFPTFKTLEFLGPVKSLECLALDVSECVDTRQKEKVLEFLKMWSIPSSFPKLRMIQTKTQKDGEFGAVWTRDLA